VTTAWVPQQIEQAQQQRWQHEAHQAQQCCCHSDTIIISSGRPEPARVPRPGPFGILPTARPLRCSCELGGMSLRRAS
jgi:hypothetical protein